MSKRKCTFTASLQSKYPFITKTKSESDVRCEKCNSDFSIAHGGGNDIVKHLGTQKHKSADVSASSSKTVTAFFKSSTPSSRDLEVAAAEGLWAYHTVQENQSFRSNDCASKIMQTCFESKFRCARTKCEAIIKNVFVPFALSELDSQLKDAHCFALLTDASNHGNVKLFPVLVRYFQPYEGTQVKLIDISSQPGESSDIVVKYLIDILEKHGIGKKLAAFCGDNTNCNFGGAERKGLNNIFRKLNVHLGRDLIGIGCSAHIVHNAIQSACDCLPVDVETIIVKIYSYFYIYTVRVQELKDFCDFVDIEYKQLLGYSKTRWLALMPAVERVLKLFLGLKSYFMSQDKCPVVLKKFFEDPCSEMWLNFVHSQAATFHHVVSKIEGEKLSAVEIMSVLHDLKDNLQSKKANVFLPHSVRILTHKLEEEGLVASSVLKQTVVQFYDTCVQYLTKWSGPMKDLDHMQWATLKQSPKWSDVEKTMDCVAKINFFDPQLDTELFDEFACVANYITSEKISEWNAANVTTDQRWVELFTHLKDKNINHQRMSELVQFIMCLPGTNASTERVFSQMNKLWTSEKTQLQIPTLKALLVTKINFKQSCMDFYRLLQSTPGLLKKIASCEKYK